MTHDHMLQGEARFCLQCGTSLEPALRAGKIRLTCPSCGWVRFEDPKVASGVLLISDERVLLVRRAFEPEKGRWALPAGFVDAHEDPRLAAARECEEETGLQVEISGLQHIFYGREHDLGADIMFVYRASLVGGQLAAHDDAEEARFFGRGDLPPLAFKSTQTALSGWI